MRRWFEVAVAVVVCLGWLTSFGAEATGTMRVATFRCDITPPLGQPMFCADPLRTVEQPLLAKGIVIEAGGPSPTEPPQRVADVSCDAKIDGDVFFKLRRVNVNVNDFRAAGKGWCVRRDGTFAEARTCHQQQIRLPLGAV